jgi:hypothetical protein
MKSPSDTGDTCLQQLNLSLFGSFTTSNVECFPAAPKLTEESPVYVFLKLSLHSDVKRSLLDMQMLIVAKSFSSFIILLLSICAREVSGVQYSSCVKANLLLSWIHV